MGNAGPRARNAQIVGALLCMAGIVVLMAGSGLGAWMLFGGLAAFVAGRLGAV